MNTLEIFIFVCVLLSDDYLTTIARKSERAVLPSVFNAFREVQKFAANPAKSRKALKIDTCGIIFLLREIDMRLRF